MAKGGQLANVGMKRASNDWLDQTMKLDIGRRFDTKTSKLVQRVMPTSVYAVHVSRLFVLG